jgi:hypothetical protein
VYIVRMEYQIYLASILMILTENNQLRQVSKTNHFKKEPPFETHSTLDEPVSPNKYFSKRVMTK